MKMKVVSLSIRTSDARTLAEPARRLEADLGVACDLYCVNCEDADDDILVFRELERRTLEADFVFVKCMSDASRFNMFERYEKALAGCRGYVFLNSGSLEVSTIYRPLFKGSDGDFVALRAFASNRGPENEYGILRWAAKALGLTSEPVPRPVEQRQAGIYHPGFPRDVGRAEYMKSLDPGRICAGILFPNNLWLYGNTAHIDALVEALDAEGVDSIPVFFSLASFSAEGVEGTRACVREHFTDGGGPVIDVLIVCSPFSQLINSRSKRGMRTEDSDNYYRTLLNVPVIQAMSVSGDYADFESDKIGLGKRDVSASVAWPEIDGQIISVPICSTPGGGEMKRASPIPDRIGHLARLARGWGSLRRKPVGERRVAILLYQHRPDSGNIGGAAGLDAVESVSDMLRRMHEAGYRVEGVPGSGRELVEEILDGVTNDLDSMSAGRMREKAAALVPPGEYAARFSEIPEFDREMMRAEWGDPPGEICVDGGDLVIPGLLKGNVFIGYQPLRGWGERMEGDYHDPTLFAQHQYLAYYRWIRDSFKADLVMHIGTHGTLEWLPGKNVGLSAKCDPDVVLDGMPNIYPYIIDDPGEGVQAKRRTESVLIGHMCPTMARAGSYEELDRANVPLQEYFRCAGSAPEERRRELASQIYSVARELSLLSDLGIEGDPGPDGFEPFIGRLHDYLTEVRDAIIRSDLHVLGRPPSGRHMDEAVYSLTRLDNGEVPSLRYAFAEGMGIDLRRMLDDPSGTTGGEVNSALVDKADGELQAFIGRMRAAGYDREACMRDLRERIGEPSRDLEAAVAFACDSLAPNIMRMADEMDHVMLGLDGGYVPPGPSGAPTRGNADILPMGRNYYGIDPDSVPSRASWETGRKMADQMIERYVEKMGEHPREIGFIIWATDTMKTGGDDVAYVLWLMGARPVWSREGGQVIGLEAVPLGELGRPRVDVTVNITGLFRDTFPNLIDLIDDAVKLVSGLDESEEDNALAANLRRDIVEGIAGGIGAEEARRRGSVRIFGAPPGAYGTGVNKMIESGAWKTVSDLADVYIDWCSHGYARGSYGDSLREEFVRRFSRVGATVKNMPDREIDLLDCDDVYEYLGGMNAFVRAYGRKDAISVMGDGSDPKRLKIRDAAEELGYVFRSKVLNPKFISGLKEHGYRGAAELANIAEYAMAWDATSGIASDWMYEGMAERFLFDEDTREWMEDANIHAMKNILDRLHEAIERGLWDADAGTRERLTGLYRDVEGRIEEATDR
ncbi:MAG: cobaltochelatase subunit CobN [Candidatus Methanoplasma sp.]|jgi:cobaltochelatase CobN|nr:cobaltochelatase subunit CobN [Candidatus Methanoplasma sp.]